MLNLELSAGSKLTKYFTKGDNRLAIDLTKQAYDKYKKLAEYIKGYMAFKKFQRLEDIGNDQMQQQIQIVHEMVELLPQKLDKMSAGLR